MYKLIEQFNLLNSNEQIYLLSILNNNFVLLEGIKSARELYSNEIGEEDFNKLAEIDISKTKKYINWICKQYLNNVDINRLKDNISKFDLMANRNLIKNKDINYYKNIEELEDIIEKSPDKSKVDIKKQIKKTKANIILDNDHYFIVEPLTWEASKIYGKGTAWCTASESTNKDWIADVKDIKARIFYVRDKTLNISNPDYKIAIHITVYYFDIKDRNKKVNYSQIPCTLWDAEDKSTSSNLEEVSIRFGIDIDKIENIRYVDFNTKQGIKNWLDSMEIENYKINKDLTVDVDGDVDLFKKNLLEIPVKFGVVDGYFDCSNNNLESLEGCPEIVKENFDCNCNELKSLEYAPKECKYFNCDYNNLTSLEGCPEIVKESFDCSNNQLKSLEGCPEIVNGNFYCYSNPKLTKEYLDNFDFSFVKGNLYIDYKDINDNWNKKNK